MTRTAEAPPADAGVDAVEGRRAGRRWRPSLPGIGARLLVLAAVVGVLLALPLGVPPVFQPVVARGAVFAIIALSMNVLIGYVGQISLGHHAFVGVGAFAAGIVLTTAGLPYAFALLAAGLVGAIAAVVLGGIALRVRGMYLALVTIAFALFVSETLLNIRAVTGGGAGMPTPRPAFALDNVPFIYFCYAVLAVVWMVDWRLTSSKTGRAIQALRDDERVAASWGINVTGYKLLAFVISGVVAGMAGALFASIDEVASPVTFQGLTLGLTIVIMVVVGGIGSRPGAVIGGVIFGTLATLLDQASEAWADCVTAWAAGWLEGVGGVPLPGPRLLQVALGAGLLWGAVRLATGMGRASRGAKVGRAVGTAVVLAAGGLLVAGAVTGTACLWAPIDGSAAPLIGALLLLGVLIFYPGGLAELLAPVFRWLSFRPFRAEARGTGPSGTTGGASHVRP